MQYDVKAIEVLPTRDLFLLGMHAGKTFASVAARNDENYFSMFKVDALAKSRIVDRTQ